jgi:acyl-CoA synthetase (NDP forming)
MPVVAALVGGARVAPGARALEEAGIPCYEFPEPAAAGCGREASRNRVSNAVGAEKRRQVRELKVASPDISHKSDVGGVEPAEMEINPLMVGPDGAVVVDARARLDG